MRYKIFIKKTDRRHFAEKKKPSVCFALCCRHLEFLIPLRVLISGSNQIFQTICEVDVYVKAVKYVCVCANLLLPNLAKLFASNCRCCYCSCYIMCFFKREMPVCMWSSQHAHHPMLKMILHVNAYGFLSLSRITRTEVTAIRRSLLAIPFMVT